VLTDADADTYDALRVNYYGQTQKSGQEINFFQRGVMCGGAQAPTDMNVYSNEIWMRDSMGVAFMSLLLALAEVGTDSMGRSNLIATSQSVIQQALFNGTITTGKPFSNTQKLFVTQMTGDQNAWAQVQTIGYWLDVGFTSSVTVDGRTEFEANYTLIYSKNDAIRKVNGTHVLI
jgi:hypothetical protein